MAGEVPRPANTSARRTSASPSPEADICSQRPNLLTDAPKFSLLSPLQIFPSAIIPPSLCPQHTIVLCARRSPLGPVLGFPPSQVRRATAQEHKERCLHEPEAQATSPREGRPRSRRAGTESRAFTEAQHLDHVLFLHGRLDWGAPIDQTLSEERHRAQEVHHQEMH